MTIRDVVFQNLDAVLAAAGCRVEDVLDVTVSVVDPQSKFRRTWAVARIPDA